MAANNTSPAFAAVTHDDRRGILWIASILAFIFILLTLGARLYVRKHMLGRDDYAMLVASAVSVAQFGTTFSVMPLGLGTSKPEVRDGNVPQTGRILITMQVLFICTMYVSKLGVLFTTERLLAPTMTVVSKICKGIRVAFGVCALASILIITIGCSAPTLLLSRGERHCSGLETRWAIVSVLDAVTELVHLATFCSIVWSLQMRTRLRTTLTILLGLRVLCPVFTGIYTWSIGRFDSSSDPATRIVSPLTWQQIALGYSVISALLTALMPFLKSFHTGMGVDVRNTTAVGSSSGYMRGSRQNASYRLDNLSKNRATTTQQSADDEEGILRPDTTGYSAVIYGSNKQRSSQTTSSQHSSMGIGAPIVMKTEISVETSNL